jgi:hypothetical protein
VLGWIHQLGWPELSIWVFQLFVRYWVTVEFFRFGMKLRKSGPATAVSS